MASRKKKVNVILVFAILVLKEKLVCWRNRQLIVQIQYRLGWILMLELPQKTVKTLYYHLNNNKTHHNYAIPKDTTIHDCI